MKKITIILVCLLLLGCSNNENPTGTFIEISDAGLSALLEATHSPDDRGGSTIRADKDTVLVVTFFTKQFGWNSSKDVWFRADKSYLRGVYLYYKIEGGIQVVAVGEGTIVGGFDKEKDLIAPGDNYFQVATIDSAWFHNNGTTLFYNNFLYAKEKGISITLGKVKIESEVLKAFGNVLRTKEEMFALSNRPRWQN